MAMPQAKPPQLIRELLLGSQYWLIWLMAWIITAMIGARAWQDHQGFLDNQQVLVAHSVDAASRQIQLQISELRRGTSAFAQQHRELLGRLMADPENPEAMEQLEKSVRGVFPEYLTLSITDARGDILVEDLRGIVGDSCEIDIRHFAVSFNPTDVYMHPQSGFPHFDMMAQVPRAGGLPAVFLLSFSPDLLARRLEYNELPGHRLLLLRRDVPGLVELSSDGVIGESLHKEHLDNTALEALLDTREVPGTRWLVVDQQQPGFFASHASRTFWGAALEIGGVFLASLIMALFIRRETRNKRALEWENARLASFPRQNPSPIVAFDYDQQLVFHNPATDELIDLAGLQSVTELLPDNYRQELSRLRDGIGAQRLLEKRLGSRTFEWQFHPVPEVQLIYGYAEDLTDKLDAEEQALLHSNELAHVGRLNLLGEMASGIAHEINQPLAAIRNYLSGLKMRLERGQTEGLPEAIAKAQDQAKRAAQIVRNMRDLARHHDPKREDHPLNAIVEKALSVLEHTIKRSPVELKQQLHAQLPLVHIDPIQIEQVIINLIKNALEAVADQPQPRIVIETGIQGSQVRFAVTDNGPGLAPEVQQMLFHPFQTTREDGLGLGLTISKTIIENHGGQLVGENIIQHDTETGGACFYFHLPLSEGDNQPSSEVTHYAPH